MVGPNAEPVDGYLDFLDDEYERIFDMAPTKGTDERPVADDGQRHDMSMHKYGLLLVCMQTSSGTLAGLTGLTHYDQLDRIMSDWLQYVRDMSELEAANCQNWQDCFKLFAGAMLNEFEAGVATWAHYIARLNKEGATVKLPGEGQDIEITMLPPDFGPPKPYNP